MDDPRGELLKLARRAGFTMLEVLVVLAVLIALAAVILPQVAGRARGATTGSLASTLTTLNEAVATFRTDVRRYPSTLVHLTTPPPAGALDACGAAIPGGLLANWRGPYLQRPVPASGLPAGDALVTPGLRRSGGTVAELTIRAAHVDGDLAADLDAAFDGDGDLSAGSIRWSAAGEDTLRFVVPVRGC